MSAAGDCSKIVFRRRPATGPPREAQTGRPQLKIALLALAVLACGQSSRGGKPETKRATQQGDWIALPPEEEEFRSSDGSFVFVLESKDRAQTPFHSTGQLFYDRPDVREKLWGRELPQEYRPRFAVVSNDGVVVLLDEWINVESRYAVMILDRENRLVDEHNFDAVASVLEVPAPEIVRSAKHGFWLQSGPRFDAEQTKVLVEAAGKTLAIRLADGALSLVSP